MKLAIIKLGCPKNDVDLEEILGRLEGDVEFVADVPIADAVLIHTCAFIESAKRESIEAILEVADYNAGKPASERKRLFVTGCLPQRYNGELKALLPEVEVFFPSREVDLVANSLRQCLALPAGMTFNRKMLTPSHYAYLTIADGCDNQCSYCAIPSIKGSYQSRSQGKILLEADRLAKNGVRELILIAQDTTRYGKDLPFSTTLPDLIYRLAEIPELRWLRLMYAHPAHWTSELTDAVKSVKQVCKYVDLPIQHISDRILTSMGRLICQAEIRRLIEEIRAKIPEAALRTSLMVGYPGESEREFQELFDFVNEVKFERLGVFTYSKEEGTRAFALRDRISSRIKQERRDLIMQAQAAIAMQKNSALMNKKVVSVIDRYDSEENKFIGRTQWDAPDIDNTVQLNEPVEIGKYYEVQIVDHSEYDLIGKPLKQV